MYDRYLVKTHFNMFVLIVKIACFNYREFDREDDLAGLPHT